MLPQAKGVIEHVGRHQVDLRCRSEETKQTIFNASGLVMYTVDVVTLSQDTLKTTVDQLFTV